MIEVSALGERDLRFRMLKLTEHSERLALVEGAPFSLWPRHREMAERKYRRIRQRCGSSVKAAWYAYRVVIRRAP